MAQQLHICCARPGLIRGGVRHPQWAAHALDAFTPEQLWEIMAEPAIDVIVGVTASPETIAEAIEREALLDATERAAEAPAPEAPTPEESAPAEPAPETTHKRPAKAR